MYVFSCADVESVAEGRREELGVRYLVIMQVWGAAINSRYLVRTEHTREQCMPSSEHISRVRLLCKAQRP